MNPERYRQIGELYHAALEVRPEERAAFLDGACAGDAGLRREVESLIASHEGAGDFIAEPALVVAAGMVAEDEAAALAGRMLRRYRVLSPLGAGGMGQVYLAEDTELGRRVALKLLPEHLTHDKQQVQRFRQEARAASQLNHPNIITVHEVGQVEGTEFIATEYVEGETLRARLQRGACGVRAALDVAAQVSAGLAAAHAAGIVHRDVKPENIMVRRDGYVKVLDFGLAKLAEGFAAHRASEARGTAGTAIRTNPGVVMGTAEYMSPEQARGLEVDARTDVWSLGCVLYEMLAGRRPFGGETHGDTIVSILEREPAPLALLAPETPAELERIVTKALEKKREARYQTAEEMANDLRRLRRRLEVDAEIELAAPGDTDEAGRRSAQTGRQATARTTSGVEYLFSEIKRHKRGAALALCAFALVLAGAGYGSYRFLNRSAPAAPFQTLKLTRLTASGKVKDAVISPDGKYVAYVEEEADRRQTLQVKQVATGSAVEVVPPEEADYFGLTFSNDSDYVYYVKTGSDGANSVLYQVPALGGASKKVTGHVDSAVAFSPDGRHLAFVRASPASGESALITANADGTGEQTLAARKVPDFFLYEGVVRISWSPDGKLIACPAASADEAGLYFNVVGVSVAGGTERVLTSRRWGWASQATWLADGSGLVMVAKEEEVEPAQLWHLSYPEGSARRITNDLNRYEDVSLTGDGKTLVTVQASRASNIWVAPEGDAARARQITFGTSDSSLGLAWTPDGKVVYQSDASGKPDLWVVNADGGEPRQLTREGYNYRPATSPASRYIVFHSHRAGRSNVWRMDLDGGNPKQLTDGQRMLFPDISPDGQWVVYASPDSGVLNLWKVHINGGAPVRLSEIPANLPTISPDGRYIAAFYWDERANPRQGVMTIPLAGGQPVKRFDILPDAVNGFALHWSPDGRALLHLSEDLSNVWGRPVGGGSPVQLTGFQGEPLFNFAWSHDGKQLALARGRAADDVMLISDAGK